MGKDTPEVRFTGVPKQYEIIQEHKGHDCPDIPLYNPDTGMWRCNTCDWTLQITAEECHICGRDAEDPPHPLPRDQFLSFPDPMFDRILSMHISCAVQVYLNIRMDLSDSDPEESGGGIP